MIKDQIYTILEEAVNSAVKSGDFPEDVRDVKIKIEYPKEQKFGDYATPFALESAKIVRQSPMAIGELVAKHIGEDKRIRQVDVAKPGFINIFISHEFMFQNILDIIEQKEEYGRNRKKKPEKINLEFVSANPTGPMNIVSARAAALGDTLANLIEFNGDTVDREFYVNDYGNQVSLLGKSVLARYRELEGESVEFPENGYQGEYIKDIARYISENFSGELEKIENEEELIEFMSRKAVEYNVEGQRKDLERFNITFKTWFRERTLHEKGDVEKSYDILNSHNAVYEEDNKKFFRSTDYGDDKDRVIIRDDGRPTYLLADIAYHYDKIKRKYDRLIDIWGPDHHGYIARLAGAVKALGFDEDKFKILIAQQVNLLVEGETVKMSKRLGKFSTMSDLIDEIGVDVARYFFVMRSMDSHLDFDLVLAKKESSENPVFYLQYAYARICSLFRESEKRGVTYRPGDARREFLENRESEVIMKLLMKFPEEVSDAAENYEPHRITTYLMRLAQSFHKFYTEHRILSDETLQSITYLALSDSVRNVLHNGLKLLGVSTPERM